MAEILTMGELIVEIMRVETDTELCDPALFKGPYASGAPAIFIDTVAKMGHSGAIIGGVGDDDFGKCLINKLNADGVDTSLVKINDSNFTGCAFVTYFADGSRKFIFHIAGTAAVDHPEVCSCKLKDTKYFHIMGCSLTADKKFGESIVELAEKLNSDGVKVSFDPNIRVEMLKNEDSLRPVKKLMEMASIFLPGKEELLMLTGCETLEDAVNKAFENANLEIHVVKNGSKGCSIYTRDDAFSLGVYPITPVDSTGAGDSFDGAFLCSLIDGKSVREAGKIASAAAALNTVAFGPMEGKISPETVSEMMNNNKMEAETICRT